MIRYRYNSNFWEINPEVLETRVFRDLYENNPIEDTSNLMWYLYLTLDHNSTYASLPNSKRIEYVDKEFLNRQYNQQSKIASIKDTAKLVKEDYIKLIQDDTENYLHAIKLALEKRADFLENTEYTPQNAKVLDDMISNSTKILEEYQKLQDRARVKQQTIKGNVVPSELAKGELNAQYKNQEKTNVKKHGFIRSPKTKVSDPDNETA